MEGKGVCIAPSNAVQNARTLRRTRTVYKAVRNAGHHAISKLFHKVAFKCGNAHALHFDADRKHLHNFVAVERNGCDAGRCAVNRCALGVPACSGGGSTDGDSDFRRHIEGTANAHNAAHRAGFADNLVQRLRGENRRNVAGSAVSVCPLLGHGAIEGRFLKAVQLAPQQAFHKRAAVFGAVEYVAFGSLIACAALEGHTRARHGVKTVLLPACGAALYILLRLRKSFKLNIERVHVGGCVGGNNVLDLCRSALDFLQRRSAVMVESLCNSLEFHFVFLRLIEIMAFAVSVICFAKARFSLRAAFGLLLPS